MPRVTYIQPDGAERELELEAGASVMSGAVNNGVPGIDADCGGQCACATCHVYVDEAWLEKLAAPREMEISMLSFSSTARANSRLSCQIEMTPSRDGLRVTLPASQH